MEKEKEGKVTLYSSMIFKYDRLTISYTFLIYAEENEDNIEQRLRLRYDPVEVLGMARRHLAASGVQYILDHTCYVFNFSSGMKFSRHYVSQLMINRDSSIVLLQLLMLTILQVELYLDNSNPEYNLDALILINAGILAVTKVICFHVRSLGLVSNFTSAVKDYKELNSEENRVIVRRHAYMGRAACISLIFCSYVGCTLFMIVPIVAGDKEEVINVTEESAMKYPVPFENTLILINMPENMYFLIFIVEYLMLLLTTTGNLGNDLVIYININICLEYDFSIKIFCFILNIHFKYLLGSDSLFFSIVFHLCGQVEILRLEYNKLSNENERTTKHITLLIKRHIYLLKLGDMLNKTISSILIVQLSSSCMLICTTGEYLQDFYFTK